MTIFVNKTSFEISEGATIRLFLEQHLPEQGLQGIAIALNNRVVPKDSWSKQFLQHEDKLTIITATQGG